MEIADMTPQAPASPITEVVEFLARGPSRAEIAAYRLSPAALDHLGALLERNAAGSLGEDEQRALDQMVLLDDILSLLRARAQAGAVSISPA